jgi:hypothetical protein
VRVAFLGELLGHPFKDPFGDSEFVPFGPHFRQLFGQLVFEFVQFRTPRGDPFQQFGIQHAPDRRGPTILSGEEPDAQLPACAAEPLFKNCFATSTASLLSSSKETPQLSSQPSRLCAQWTSGSSSSG